MKATRTWARLFVRNLKKIGLDRKGYTLRTFRKTFQTLASSYGMDPAVTDELVGYEHQKTSHKYYISLNRQINELKKYHIPKKGDVY